MVHKEIVLILDFGSQYTQLIARRIREQYVYSEIHPHNLSLDNIKKISPKGIILSGGPMSIYENNSPQIDPEIFSLGIPILGICYGLQLISKTFNGSIEPAPFREYGKAHLHIKNKSSLLKDINDNSIVWMSHGDYLTKLPDNFTVDATSENSPYCVISDIEKKIFGVQFHPEVVHTEEGKKIVSNFIFDICKCKGEWTPKNIVEQDISNIKNLVNDDNVICALSGGVDSSVAAVLVHQAVGDKLICVHVDTGLMRKNESEYIVNLFNENYNIKLVNIKASDMFISRLKGITDPEKKRKIIGNTFIEIFEEEAKKYRNVKFLVQGTLYPDVIESVSVKGKSSTIKTHHNVGGLPKKMNLKLIEPFRELFKDEVREVGKILELPDSLLMRHPFPGPGLAVRILGDVTKEKLDVLREVDEIYINEIKENNFYDQIWQAFAVLLPVRSVGVMGDSRTYENVIVLRAVTSLDGMTADWFKFPSDFLEKISNKIIRTVRGVNRVVYDISSKPPATIEWE
ncbi:MAG: glutamine-hydrolyzing GMP synthase [Ignavibacteriales bacterium]|nr:glutamine-hydrolyzing GMP synthase [Ignavibacteriales bacterium]